jgi:hypothetical protein
VKIKITLWIFLFWIAAACSPIQLEPPPPSPQPVHLAVSTAIDPILKESIHKCAVQEPKISAIVDVYPSSLLPEKKADITIQLGEQVPLNGYHAYQLGWEKIYIIANPAVNIDQIGQETILNIFSSEKPSLSPITYPEGHILQDIFKGVFLDDREFSPNALIAANPEVMVKGIRQDPNAIGYAPDYWINNGVKILQLDIEFQNALRLPVLAITPLEPDPIMQKFLICLQQTWIRNSE